MSNAPEYAVLIICWLLLVGTVYALSLAADADETDHGDEGIES